MRTSSQITGSAILILLFIAALVWSFALRADSGGKLTVSFLDTGKGNAIFIEAPSGRTVLVNGGADAGILRSLGAVLPWWQRGIDVVIAVEPDAAHALGLIDVLQRYSVARVFVSSAEGSGPVMQTFNGALVDARQKGVQVQVAERGQVIQLGDGAFIEILFPDRDLAGSAAGDACIEMRLVYGHTSFMLSCGNTAVENYLVRLDGSALHSDVLAADAGAASSSPLFAGFVGAQFTAQAGERYVSDGKTVSLKD